MKIETKITILRWVFIPVLVHSAVFFYEAAWPHQQSPHTAVVASTLVKSRSKGDTFMAVVEDSHERDQASVPEHIFRRLQVGDEVNIMRGRVTDSWLIISASRDGSTLIPPTNINSGAMIFLAALMLALAATAFLPSHWVAKHSKIRRLIMLAAGVSIINLTRVVLF